MFACNVAYINDTASVYILKESIEASQSITGMSVEITAGYPPNGDGITWLYVSFKPFMSLL
jgi:hypothetical protein